MSIREAVAGALFQVWLAGDKDEFASLEAADAAITAFLEAAAKEGWRMRLDEATDEMIREGESVVYRAMLAAAPKFEWDK